MIAGRRVALNLVAGVLLPLPSFAQQPDRVRSVGFLATRSRPTSANPDVYYDAFVQGMREFGYVVGKNLIIEWRYAEGRYERLPALASELVQLRVDVLMANVTSGVQALQQATNAIPIVFGGLNDPVGNGVVTSLARPGGNVTGTSIMTSDISSKYIELLKAMVPKLSRVAVLLNPGNPSYTPVLNGIRAVAPQVGIKLLELGARTPEDIERSFSTMTHERTGAMIVINDGFFIGQRRQLADLAIKSRMPAIFAFPEHVTAGGLMSYGPNLVDSYRRMASYADRIFKGAMPGDLPIEQPTNFELVINMRTAKALDIEVPRSILVQVTKVIE